MNKIKAMKKRDGFLCGQLLIAMPSQEKTQFERSVIYICAHSDEGAMGIVLNQRQDMTFPDLLIQLGILNKAQTNNLPDPIKFFPVRNGGPVERTRGFILHTSDYACQTTTSVSKNICLTSTTDILKAISRGRGPHQAIMALGYAGWGAGQIEEEIYANSWITSKADDDFLFSTEIDQQYEQSLKRMGIDLAFLVSESGHA